jgi:crossover junction endodeoxyribonuclease RusA
VTAVLNVDGTWILELDLGRAPLTMNAARQMHYRTYGKRIKELRDLARQAALDARIPPLGRCEVTMYYQPPTNIRRDADGLVATLKPLCDGLVDAGIVDDDIPALMLKHMPVIEPSAKPARVWLVVRRLKKAA